MTIGGPKSIASTFTGNTVSKNACNVSAVASALAVGAAVPPPAGCDALTITIGGPGKYTFATRASADIAARAESYLESAVARTREAWAAAVLDNGDKADTSLDAVDDVEVEGSITCFSSKAAKNPVESKPAASMTQPSLSIGLIGDVANGKSTLVRAMTGKRTQQHSSEQQKHGMSIRLGFANAAILRCQDHALCGLHAFQPESEDVPGASLPPCTNCGGSMDVAARISLIDCPGHAELMATMLAGASAFDAVILAASANAPCPSPQAKQHLEALKLSRILARNGNIAIAQTKAELVADQADQVSALSATERLAQHASNAREALQTTVAAGAPFFPTCAPLGLGLEPLARWLTNLQTNGSSVNSDTNQLNVLRSFDVNRPGSSIETLNGGVLGGTISGAGAFHPGDLLEVRPGLLLTTTALKTDDGRSKKCHDSKEKDSSSRVSEHPFSVRPLQCHCVALMTGKTPLQKATAGGLVAFRTTLCPSLCADDRLVGSVVGPPGTLPPVWGPGLLLDSIQFVDVFEKASHKSKHNPIEGLKKHAKVRCHSGSATVRARVVRVSVRRGKLEVQLEAPLCAYKGGNVAIEAEAGDRSGTFRLVAHARIYGGTCCYEGAETTSHNVDTSDPQLPEIELAVTEAKDEDRRFKFLEELAQHHAGGNDNGARIAVPQPVLSRDGGAHILIDNFAVIAASLRREPRHLQAYLEQEGALSCAPAGDNNSSLRVRWRGGRGFPERLSKIIRRYAFTFVTCHQCNRAQTELTKAMVGNKTELLCRLCNARRFVPKL